MQWAETSVTTPRGRQTAIAPLVISASRTTDIPAFHAKWLMHRLNAGYCAWVNPFNARQRQYISFEKSRIFVFWSKHPAALVPYLPEIRARDHEFYFHYTLNDYELFGLEQGLPPLRQRIDLFKRLSDLVGNHRVIWRFDPIILGAGLSVENTLDRLYAIGKEVAPYTEKLVFSFVDWYKKTQRKLYAMDTGLRPPVEHEMLQIAEGIAEIAQTLPSRMRLATCAEELDLSFLGIEHNKCIDPDLLLRLCPTCSELQKAYSKPKQTNSQGLLPDIACKTRDKISSDVRKDCGQRKLCGCAPSKDIGTYNTCMYFCTYCYATQSKNSIIQNIDKTNIFNDQL